MIITIICPDGLSGWHGACPYTSGLVVGYMRIIIL